MRKKWDSRSYKFDWGCQNVKQQWQYDSAKDMINDVALMLNDVATKLNDGATMVHSTTTIVVVLLMSIDVFKQNEWFLKWNLRVNSQA